MQPSASLSGRVALGRSFGLSPHVEPAPGSLLGLEHEYSLTMAGQPVDFRELIHRLPIDGLRIDPADINAYRCSNGLALTCDEAEAEVASPPVLVAPGFGRELAAWAASGRSMLENLLPPDVTAAGYSTHISVAMPDEINDEVCDLFIRTFGPAVALVLEGPDSLGIYVRPRPGRLEVCGEFVEGERLQAVAALIVGGARACVAHLAGETPPLPPVLACQLLPGVERYGLRLHRHSAFGFDYYAEARASVLPLAEGGPITGQAHIKSAWAAARARLALAASDEDLDTMEAIAAGTLPLGVEGGFRPVLASAPPGRSPFCELAKPRRRRGLELSTVAATWETAIVRAANENAARYLTVPRAGLGEFFAGLDSGVLDAPLMQALAAAADPAPGSPGELRTFGVYSTAPDPALLIPAEREPGTAHGASTKSGRSGKRKVMPARPFKFVPVPFAVPEHASPSAAPLPPLPPPPPVPIPPIPPAQPEPSVPPAPPPVPPQSPPWRPSPLVVILVAGGAAIAVAAGALAVVHNGGNGGEPTPTATTTSVATPTASVAAGVSTPTPVAPTVTASPTAKPSETATSPASPSATATRATETVTPGAGPTQTTTPSATARPTDIVPPTFTPTPSPTPTRTATATPTRTATRAPIPTLPVIIVATATPACTPSAVTACPTPIP